MQMERINDNKNKKNQHRTIILFGNLNEEEISKNLPFLCDSGAETTEIRKSF